MEGFWALVVDAMVFLAKIVGALLIVQFLLYVGGADVRIPFVFDIFWMLKELVYMIKQLFPTAVR